MSSTTMRVDTCTCRSDQEGLRLYEAEHRHGNSLQILANLTRRSLRDAKGEEAREALGSVCELIDTMIALHKICQDREDDLSVLIHGMVSNWQRLCSGHIRIVTDLEEGLEIPKGTQTVAILIAQELVTNAIKHAFPDRHNGTIWIRLYAPTANDVTLQVEDDGVGPTAGGSEPAETAETAATRPAGTLVRDLAVLLGGTVRHDRVRRGTGSCISVRWPV